MQGGFYRYIYKLGNNYWVMKNNEKFLECRTLEEALYERDRLIKVDWDWDLFVELPETTNNYIHIDLPPFNHKPKYISFVKEHWVVLSKNKNNGSPTRYYGSYYSEDEAKEVAFIYNARIVHYPPRWKVQRRIDGKTKNFGYYESYEDAENRVVELIENGWKK